MPAVSELAKLKKAIAELGRVLGGNRSLPDADRRALKSEIEDCVQRLDELRNRI